MCYLISHIPYLISTSLVTHVYVDVSSMSPFTTHSSVTSILEATDLTVFDWKEKWLNVEHNYHNLQFNLSD